MRHLLCGDVSLCMRLSVKPLGLALLQQELLEFHYGGIMPDLCSYPEHEVVLGATLAEAGGAVGPGETP